MASLSSQQVLKEKQTRDANTITSISLTHRALSDISCLSEFQNLERLDLAFNNLTSLQGLSSCVKLKWLSVVQNKLESLKGIESLSNLTVLNAGKNKIKSIDEVRSLVSLRALILNDNEIVSICKLDQMKELNTLVLSRNPIREIGESLFKVKSMTKLSLSNCHLQTIGSSLKSCIELKELRLAHNDIKTLPAELAYNKKLQNLDLGNNLITRWSDVKVLSSLVDLKNLNLLGNPIAENAKITKKVQKFLPNLHIFNARPVDKSARNEISGRADDSSLIPTNELDYHSEKKKDHTRDVNSSKHVTDQRSDHFDNASDDGEKDLRQKRKKTKGKVSKMEEASTDEQDDAVIEKKLKRDVNPSCPLQPMLFISPLFLASMAQFLSTNVTASVRMNMSLPTCTAAASLVSLTSVTRTVTREFCMTTIPPFVAQAAGFSPFPQPRTRLSEEFAGSSMMTIVMLPRIAVLSSAGAMHSFILLLSRDLSLLPVQSAAKSEMAWI